MRIAFKRCSGTGINGVVRWDREYVVDGRWRGNSALAIEPSQIECLAVVGEIK